MPEVDGIAVEVVYALPDRCWRWPLRLVHGARIADALEEAALTDAGLDLAAQPLRVGIFGREVALDSPLRDGDRVELYRPLRCDPRAQRRERADQERGGRRLWRRGGQG